VLFAYPASHASHAQADVCPLLPVAEIECKGHATQLPDPTTLLNVPASHAAHATPSEAAVYPGRHAQSVSSMLPAAEMVFAGHAAQLSNPSVSLYVPAKHATHAPPSASVNPAVYPGRHAQSARSVLPTADAECVGQAAQVSDPAVAVYVPATHAAQLPDPAADL